MVLFHDVVEALTPHPRPAALQQRDVLLAGDGAGVVGIDDIHAGARIARQRQQVDALAVKQAERDGRVAQAVQAARLPVRAHLQAGFGQDPVEVKVQYPVRVVAVLQGR